MRILPPDQSSKRARFADWLELIALTSSNKQASIANLQAILRIEVDDRTPVTELDPQAEELGEPEITNRFSEDLEDRIVQELEFRQRLVGEAYPYEIVQGAGSRSVILRCTSNFLEAKSGKLFYTFCLLDSAIREKLILVPKNERHLVGQIGNIFQICSCLAVGGYLGVEVVSFGFPRAVGDSFLPALQSVWTRYGSFQVLTSIPHGFDDKLKDGGVDIIAWRHFPDRFAATILMFVQVASGLDWKDKEVTADVRSIKQWFNGVRFEHFLPAICIPFPLWFDLDEPTLSETGEPVDFYRGVQVRFMYREGKFGVIFDRGRIARSAAVGFASSGSEQSSIDGCLLVDDVIRWIGTVLSNLAEKRVVA